MRSSRLGSAAPLGVHGLKHNLGYAQTHAYITHSDTPLYSSVRRALNNTREPGSDRAEAAVQRLRAPRLVPAGYLFFFFFFQHIDPPSRAIKSSFFLPVPLLALDEFRKRYSCTRERERVISAIIYLQLIYCIYERKIDFFSYLS